MCDLDKSVGIVQWQKAAVVASAMQRHLTYANESQRILSRSHGYRWKIPAETVYDGYGFCYDLAAYALNALATFSFRELKLLFVWWGEWGRVSQSGHMVCQFQIDDGLYMIDNGFLKGPYQSREALISHIARGRQVKGYRFFDFPEIPFHLRYSEMDYFTAP